MFMHRLSKFGRASLFALCLLLVGGSLSSCKDWLDDYKYDDEEPDWLGASIYDFLKEGSAGHTYNNFVELIDSLGEKETLAHTGSNTLFVADDEAFARFYEDNPWGVKSIQEMTPAQRKVLLYNSMLNNALLLDMMSSTGSGTDKEGTCLRRLTSFSVIDTIPLVSADFFEKHAGWPVYNQYWDALRGKDRSKKLRLAMDGTDPMMVHFFEEFLKNNAIQASDIEFLFKKDGVATNTFELGDALIFNRKMVASGVDAGEFSEDTMTITCKNGYIYRLDGVLLPPTNMAGELRQREDTRIFSHLLDRFCIPVYDAALSADFKKRYAVEDSIFRLRYFTKESDVKSNSLLEAKNMTPLTDELLNFDPGWNTFSNSLSKEEDMAAMFVPRDDVLYKYFASKTGGGKFLLDRFAPNMNVAEDYSMENVDALLEALDNVPQVNIASFLNNLMKSTFVGTVPSKFEKVTNDANDDMKLREKHVDECIVANNGVIYILNEVFGPAAYSAVSAPTLVNDNMYIMRNIIKQLRYDYYLLAMDAEYSFIVPDDNHFVYFDPVTFTGNGRPEMYKFHYDDKRPKGNGAIELWAEHYNVDTKTLELDTTVLPNKGPYDLGGSNFGGDAFMKNRMMDIMEYLIIVHEEGEKFSSDKQYYSTKGYGTIKVDASDASNVKIYGGEQIETGTEVLVSATHTMENGLTYNTIPGASDVDSVRMYSAIPTPPRTSVYTNMKKFGEEESDIYYEFFQLCNPENFSTLLNSMYEGLEDYDASLLADSLKLYSIFYSESDGTAINTVPFFNTYHYTVYVPSNESVKEMYSRGLPTWKQVNDIAKKHPLKAASAMRLINKFARHHFQDNSVYHDKSPFTMPSPDGKDYVEATFATSIIDDETGRFYETVVKSAAGNKTIIVKDQLTDKSDEKSWAAVVNTPGQENITWNVMCRDIIYNVNNSTEKKPTGIATSSFAVIQPLDRALLNRGMFGYDNRFRRFASTGDWVDVMTVPGGKGGNIGRGEDVYLVARCGKKSIEISDSVSIETETAYLMKPIEANNPDWDATLTRETLVEVDGKPMLITADGYLLDSEVDETLETTIYRFKTVKGEDGKDYRIKVGNDGVEIGKATVESASKSALYY